MAYFSNGQRAITQEGDMIELTIPYPPTVNHYYGRAKNGNVYIKFAGKTFRRLVMLECLQKDVCTIHGYVLMQIDMYPPDKRIRNIDNILKALLDALEHGGAYDDDDQIIDLHIKKHVKEIRKGGVIVVRFEELSATGNVEVIDE